MMNNTMPTIDSFKHVLSARTVEDAWDRYVERLTYFGFPHLLYFTHRIIRTGEENVVDEAIELTSLPGRLLSEVLDQGLMHHVPMLRWIVRNLGCQSFDWLHERQAQGRLQPEDARCLALFRDHGLGHGMAISLADRAPRLRGGALILGPIGATQAELDGIWQTRGREVETLTLLLHQRLANLPFRSPEQILTLRQREALELAGIGFNTQEIATRLDLSAATVEKHMRLARHALGARTTAQAVMIAVTRRQIFVDPGEGCSAVSETGRRGPTGPWTYRQFPDSAGHEPSGT